MTRRDRWAAAGLLLGLLEGLRRGSRARRRLDLRDRVCIVSGGSRGLGLAVSRQLLSKGARVVLAARDEEEMGRAAGSLGAPDRVMTVRCDVRLRADSAEVIDRTLDRWGAVDVLINNAGVIQVGPVDHMEVSDFEDAMNVHFWGPLYFMLGVVPIMRRAGRGRIVNISSVGGLVAVPHLAPYCASKFALVGLSDALRAELAPHGIRVTTACPWIMRTGSAVYGAMLKGAHEQEFKWFAGSSSLPLLTVDADCAARRIVDAAEYGEPFVGMSPLTRIASVANALAPGLVGTAARAVERLLPAPAGWAGDVAIAAGRVQARRGPSLLTRLQERAAGRNNEGGPLPDHSAGPLL